MTTKEKKILTPTMDYPLDESGKPVQKMTPSSQEVVRQETVSTPTKTTTVTQTTPAPDPFADYTNQAQQQYANTLADIRKRRQELEAKYQPDIDRQRKIMKIIALGKLIGQLGQLVGGGHGTPVVDKDPYQINAWNELRRMQNEQKYYGQQLDAEERAAQRNMQQGLNRLQYEKARYNRDMATLKEKERIQTAADARKHEAAMEIARFKAEAAENLKKHGHEYAMAQLEARLRNSLAVKQAGYEQATLLKILGAEIAADARQDSLNTTTVTTTTKDANGNTVRTTRKQGTATRPKKAVSGFSGGNRKKPVSGFGG